MNIGVVIVTYNRIDKLKEALTKFEIQKKRPAYVLVVNNASTDDTEDYLEWWEDNETDYSRYVVNCKYNSGGSGGFAIALTEALKYDAEWIWISDDDAFPEEDTLLKVDKYLKNNVNRNIVAISTTVINNGKIDMAHRRRIKKRIFTIKEFYADICEYDLSEFEIDEFSYVGTVISKEVMNDVGVTNANFFINQDDTEHSLRISKMGKIMCVPSIIVNHNTDKTNEISWKRYYEIRNKYYVYKLNFPGRYSKIFYMLTAFKYYVKKIFKLRSYDELNMYKCALYDIRHNIMGMHGVYKPGWIHKETAR